jgi:hypothetical protein
VNFTIPAGCLMESFIVWSSARSFCSGVQTRDVIKTGTSETKTKTRPVKTKTKIKTGPIETKTTKKWSWTVLRPRPGLETNISVIKFD